MSEILSVVQALNGTDVAGFRIKIAPFRKTNDPDQRLMTFGFRVPQLAWGEVGALPGRAALHTLEPRSVFDHYLSISRLLAGQLDFHSVIRSVAAEISHVIPYDHFDVCIIMVDEKYHIAYESGLETDWGKRHPAPVSDSPIRTLLWGEVDHLLTDDACNDPRFHFEGAFSHPIISQELRSRLHVPLKVQGNVIGALSCSSHQTGLYGLQDVENARAIADLLAPHFFAIRTAEQAKRSAIVEAEARAREEGLRLGALKLTEALEAERQRIGMDLHDQTLADLTRLSRRMERLAHTPDVTGEALEPLFRGLQQCMHDLRQIIEEAKPSVLQLFGFAQAVENHLERSIQESGAGVEWKLTDETNGAIDCLEQSVSIALFRIAQEAINNAVRHAQASRILVRLGAAGGALTIEIDDDGVGLTHSRKPSGGGIENMKTRARLISARFAARPAGPRGGTCVSVTLAGRPLAAGGAA
ncbi:putative two-component histidine kinase [Rhizobium rhizogenes NBRC 13257]|uniref:Two-component histidine kinase n=1 Tax=Rhizobium rhizogenes NBRC 13257 TaxID=1220581 RepID=A0AA87QEK1_RHIRH|nr:putative two-component histidine kinase [Rhizobium rhizogenes NBRC 13257]